MEDVTQPVKEAENILAQKKTIKDFSLTELKAMAYDSVTDIEKLQANIRIINQEINLRQNG